MTTKLTMHYLTNGLGDTQAAEQFTDAFNRYVAKSDPGWGHVVIAAGIHGGSWQPVKGDINFYWWWSGSDREDWFEYYFSKVETKPDVILCTSRKMYDYVRGKKLKAIYLPIGTGPDFYPLDLPRSGTGYCGAAPPHKPQYQEDAVIEPARDYGFEWKVIVNGGRPELNRWYNSLACGLGMTAEVTMGWGIVPSRTYEVLATATPYITYRHWSMNNEIGFNYPWQSGSAGETTAMLKELIDNYAAHKDEFRLYAEVMRLCHSWDRRVEQLAEGMKEL